MFYPFINVSDSIEEWNEENQGGNKDLGVHSCNQSVE